MTSVVFGADPLAGTVKYPACTVSGALDPVGQYREALQQGVGTTVPSGQK